MILLIKGFFIGLANLIPGVSGGTIAITLGVYDKLISSISHIFKNIKDNLKFLIPVFIGIILSILSLSKVMSFALDKYLFITVLFFIGAIIGGIPMLYKKVSKDKIKVSSIIIFLTTFVFVILLTFLSGSNNVIISFDFISLVKIFIVGIIAAATMVIPGVSGSAVLMMLGYYEPIVNMIKDITKFNMNNIITLVIFGIGVVVGILLIAKLIEYLLKKFEVKTYYGILGFVIASIISIIISNFIMNSLSIGAIDIIIGVVLFILGFIIAYKLGDK